MNTSKSWTDVNHIKPERWPLSWLMLTGMPSARRCAKASEGEDWEEMYESLKEMSRAVGAKKPQEAQKAKAL